MRTHRFAALLALFTLLPATAHGVTIVSHSEHYDASNQTYYFNITFNAPPDFFTVDSNGNNLDSFQYQIDYNITDPPFYPAGHPTVLIRGSEIKTSNAIPIRDATGDGGPNSGGWGPIRGIVPYQLVGAVLTFSVPFAMIGDPDGQFAYYLLITRFGGTADERTGISDRGETVPVARSSWGRVKALYR